MQDFLGLGNEARMNYPGNPSGNWKWRLTNNFETADLIEKISTINYLFDRNNPYNITSESESTSK
jgi:4-alpha-glucanotransferase